MKIFKKIFLAVSAICLCLTASNPAVSSDNVRSPDGKHYFYSDDNNSADLSHVIEESGALVYPPLTLRQNMVEVLSFQDDVGSILMSNPAPVEMIVENSRRVMLRPAQPGVTTLTVINKAGQIIYKRDIVVTQRGENYVRVTRFCSEQRCDEEDFFFCPNGCYGVKSDRDTASGFAPVTGVNAQDQDNGYQPPVPGAYPQPPMNIPDETAE